MTIRLVIALGAMVALTVFTGFATRSTSGNQATSVSTAEFTSAPAVADSSGASNQAVARQDDADDTSDDSSATTETDTVSAGTVTMTLLHNNDGESKLLPNPEAGFPGIARFAEAWVELGRGSDADILLRVSAGDNFLASKEFSVGLARDDQPLFDSIALRGLYEAMALGNHDFDFGPEVTARFIEGFRLNDSSDPVTFVAANIDVSAEPALQELVDAGRIAKSTVVTDPSSGLEVGVVGAITPRLPNISSPRGVVVDADVAAAINAEVALLSEAGIDRIVLVSHLQGLGEDRELVPQLSGVDIVVAGGGDELLKNAGDSCLPAEDAVGSYPLLLTDADGNDVPVVTAPGGYRCIGRLDVTFDDQGQLTRIEGSSIGVDVDGPAEEFAMTRVEEPLAAALADLEAAPLGQTLVVLDGRRSSVRTGPTNIGELLADAVLFAAQSAPEFGGPTPIVAVQNGGGIRNDAEIAAGPITEADTFDIAPFANFVVAGDVPRDRLKDLLEVGVAGLPDAEGTYPQIAGMSIEVDVAQPARVVDADGDCSLIGDPGARIRTVTLDDGTEVVRDGQVVAGPDVSLATIDFLANGGDCYPLGDLGFTKVGVSYQQALRAFIIEELVGVISADRYPVGGSRATIANPEGAADPAAGDETDDTDAPSEGEDDSDVSGGADADAEAESDLPDTGADSWLVLIVALTAATAGGLVVLEAQRSGRLSLHNRLVATRAWLPEDDAES